MLDDLPTWALAALAVTWIALTLSVLAGTWRVFGKAGRPGWASLVPIYNGLVLLKIAGRPSWWLLLLLIPLVGAIALVVVCVDLARSFGKSAEFGLLVAFLPWIGLPMLGFGAASYEGAQTR